MEISFGENRTKLVKMDTSFLTTECYTPKMFANLLEVTLETVRHWHRRGWLREAEVIMELPYFAPTELQVGKRLAQLAKNGLKNAEIEKKLNALQALFPDVDRPIATVDLRIDGRDIILTKQGELVDTFGQKLFDFAQPDPAGADTFCDMTQLDRAFQSKGDFPANLTSVTSSGTSADKDELCQLAHHCEEQGWLEQAAEFFRAALVAGGPDASLCFQLGELLYRLDDKAAARERYYMAIEIDENFVEARANLGCVLAETGEPELAVSAFQGALLHHPDYADVHYHLAMTLQQLGKPLEAEQHLTRFRELVPNSPWAEKID